MKTTITVVTALALSAIAGCETWHGFGKDIGKASDSMTGKGKYTMTVRATPERATAAARKAVEQLRMTDIGSSGDRGKGKVTARTAQQEKVTIDIKQSNDKDCTVTIHFHGYNADEVTKQIQDQIDSNLR
ncbi:MAG: DUF3568 family protein [Phycisphaerae bacterium]